jgi:cytidine deaminase
MNQAERDELIRAALDAQQRAFCPYSNFPVGAAIRAASGKIVQGVNVENASFGLTICAERVAAAAAVAAGNREFAAIAIVSRGGVAPCGACRQFLAEFNPRMSVVMVDSERLTEIRQSSLDVLLPGRFEGPIA